MQAIQRLQVADEELRRVQENVIAGTLPIFRLPILDGLLLEGEDSAGVALVAGAANNVSHLLNRRARGWMLVSPSAAATVYEDPADVNPDPERFLVLRCTANVTVRLWVF